MPALLDAPSSLHDAYPGASIQAIRTSPGCKAAMEIARVGYAHPGFGTARSDGDGDGFLLSVSLTGARRVLYGAAPPRALPLAPDEITIRPADAPYRADPLFVDQLALAAQVHIIQAYGGGAPGSRADPAPARGGLAVWQQKLARDMLAADLLADVSISDVAQGCGLSRSYFIKAFRQTMGTTPHRWLLECRVERAKILLLNSEAPVSDVARDCGFSDQAHLTRVFASVLGAPPAAWRRQNRN